MLQELLVKSSLIAKFARLLIIKKDVIRVSINKSHTALISKPRQFIFPNIDGLFSKVIKECGILREGIGKLDVTFSVNGGIGLRHPKRKNASNSIGLRL